MEITRDKDHVYRVDGRVMPSVHTVLESVGIVDTTYIHEYYLDRGSYVHTITDLLDANNLDEDSLDDRLKPFASAYKKVLDSGVRCLEKGRYIYDPVGYCGEFDKIVDVGNGKRTLLEVKTNTQPWWTFIQLGAYFRQVEANELRVLVLKKDGTFSLSAPISVAQAKKAWVNVFNAYTIKTTKGKGKLL